MLENMEIRWDLKPPIYSYTTQHFQQTQNISVFKKQIQLAMVYGVYVFNMLMFT